MNIRILSMPDWLLSCNMCLHPRTANMYGHVRQLFTVSCMCARTTCAATLTQWGRQQYKAITETDAVLYQFNVYTAFFRVLTSYTVVLHIVFISKILLVWLLLLNKMSEPKATKPTFTKTLEYYKEWEQHLANQQPRRSKMKLDKKVYGNTMIENYCDFDETLLHKAAWQGKTEVVKELLQQNCDLNRPAKRSVGSTSPWPAGYTALHLAAEYGNHECLKLLIEVNAEKLFNRLNLRMFQWPIAKFVLLVTHPHARLKWGILFLLSNFLIFFT